MWWKKNKWKVLAPALILAVLTAAFYFGGNAAGSRGWTVAAQPSQSADESSAQTEEASASAPQPAAASSAAQEEAPDASRQETAASEPEQAQKEAASAETAASGTAEPEQTQPAAASQPEKQTEPAKQTQTTQPAQTAQKSHTCTISISCATILNNLELCKEEKKELVPSDGWILQPVEAEFYDGESVFNVLARVCKQQGIQMEFENTPLYDAAYIEGIANLYEFDVGELSGWMYKVNDWFPNYGCSSYTVKDGDVICWEYTCDRGGDVGGDIAAQSGS